MGDKDDLYSMNPLDPSLAKAREMFVEELGSGLEAIERILSAAILANQELSELRQLLHRIKGGAGFFGFSGIEEQSRDFEGEVLRQSKLGAADASILRGHFEKLIGANSQISCKNQDR